MQRRVPERDRPLGARRAVVADHGRLGSRAASGPARPGSRSWPRRAGTAARRRRRAPAAAAAAARSRRASRRRRGRRAPRRRRRSARFVSTSPQRSWCGSTPTWSMSGFVRISVRPLAHLPAALGCGVAVVDRGAQLRQPEGAERPELVLRERLRRVEVERAALRLARERVEHRQVERERLPARRPRRDDQVLAAGRRLPGLRLVGVERVDPLGGERVADARVELVRQRRGSRLACRLGPEVRELLALRAGRPRAATLVGHATMVALPHRGALTGLRSHPSNLIRVMPAKGGDGSTRFDDRGLRLRRRRRDPGRPEGVRGRRLPRHERDRRADRAEHDRRDRRARGAAGVRPRAARGGLRRHRRRRGQDGDALLDAR